MRSPQHKKAFGISIATALVLAVSACSSTGGQAAQQSSAAPAAAGGGVSTERFTVAMVTHAPPGDTFWDKVRVGAEDAAKALNVELRYSNAAQAPDQATLVNNAVDQGVRGLAGTLTYPDAVGPAMKAAADKGIPTVALNAGLDDYQDYGAQMYFGSDELVAGNAVGERLQQAGAGKAICVLQEQGQKALETRCAGVKEKFSNTENLQVNGQDAAAVRQTIGAKLQQDKSITHIVTLGAQFALIASDAKADASSTAEIATFDLNKDVAQAIQDGKVLFSVDQQPYVQGFMAVQSLWLKITNGNDLGGGGPVLTGPSFVDKGNIAAILTYANNNKR